MSNPHTLTLTSLTQREAITDALYRAIIAFDHNDIPALNSAAVEDVVFQLYDRETKTVLQSSNSLTEIRDGVLAHVGPMDTTHTITNIRIDVKDGADTASLTANALAQHCPPGRGKEPNGPKLLVGGEYRIDLVKVEDGLWKIKKWVLDIIWRQGDASVMERTA